MSVIAVRFCCRARLGLLNKVLGAVLTSGKAAGLLAPSPLPKKLPRRLTRQRGRSLSNLDGLLACSVESRPRKPHSSGDQDRDAGPMFLLCCTCLTHQTETFANLPLTTACQAVPVWRMNSRQSCLLAQCMLPRPSTALVGGHTNTQQPHLTFNELDKREQSN